MNILLVTPMPPRAEAAGAIPLVLQGALVGLLERHDVTLITAAGDEPGERDAVASLTRAGLDIRAVDTRQPQGVARWRRRIRLASTWLGTPYPWRTVWFADPGFQHQIDTAARARAYDIYVVHDSALAVFRPPTGVATVVTEHEVQPDPPGATGLSLHTLDGRRWRGFQTSAWRRFDGIEVFTQRDAEAVSAIAADLSERVYVDPFGIVLPKPVDTKLQEPGLVLFVGNFTHPPNVDAALWLAEEIAPRVRRESPDARFAFVGRAVPPKLAALHGRGLEIVGEVDRVETWLERAAVVAAPVRRGGGMRMKVLHSLASAKAVVTTSRGVDGLLLGDEEPPLLIEDSDTAIAEGLVRLLRDDALRARLATRGRALVEREHSASAYGRRLERVYEDVIARGHARDSRG
jgi:glycosyltransferase involved in cell wall biosynthesis